MNILDKIIYYVVGFFGSKSFVWEIPKQKTKKQMINKIMVDTNALRKIEVWRFSNLG